jgi:hypothetical protein
MECGDAFLMRVSMVPKHSSTLLQIHVQRGNQIYIIASFNASKT